MQSEPSEVEYTIWDLQKAIRTLKTEREKLTESDIKELEQLADQLTAFIIDVKTR